MRPMASQQQILTSMGSVGNAAFTYTVLQRTVVCSKAGHSASGQPISLSACQQQPVSCSSESLFCSRLQQPAPNFKLCSGDNSRVATANINSINGGIDPCHYSVHSTRQLQALDLCSFPGTASGIQADTNSSSWLRRRETLLGFHKPAAEDGVGAEQLPSFTTDGSIFHGYDFEKEEEADNDTNPPASFSPCTTWPAIALSGLHSRAVVRRACATGYATAAADQGALDQPKPPADRHFHPIDTRSSAAASCPLMASELLDAIPDMIQALSEPGAADGHAPCSARQDSSGMYFLSPQLPNVVASVTCNGGWDDKSWTKHVDSDLGLELGLNYTYDKGCAKWLSCAADLGPHSLDPYCTHDGAAVCFDQVEAALVNAEPQPGCMALPAKVRKAIEVLRGRLRAGKEGRRGSALVRA